MIDLYAPTGYMLTFTYCRILSDEITKKQFGEQLFSVEFVL